MFIHVFDIYERRGVDILVDLFHQAFKATMSYPQSIYEHKEVMVVE